MLENQSIVKPKKNKKKKKNYNRRATTTHNKKKRNLNSEDENCLKDLESDLDIIRLYNL